MSSKIEKQKQIFSLLNSKFPVDMDVAVKTEADEQKKTASQKVLEQARLIYQVYSFYKNLIQNLDLGLLTIDLGGEITFANRSAALLLGVSGKDLLGKNILQFFHQPEEGEHFLSRVKLSKKRISEQEFHFHTMDGRDIIVGVNASRLQDDENNFKGIIVLLRDLTEIRQLRNQLERMERLALMGELSAGIAHEIRNPLAGIKASAQVLEETFGVDDYRAQLVTRIIKEVDKANRLLKDFFRFAKPSRPKFGFHDIEMIVDSVYLLLAPKMKKRNIQFEEKFEENIPQVFVDDAQIEQVILNLFLNAIDAMEGGGVLTVKTRKKKLDTVPEDLEKLTISDQDIYYVIVEISDTGPGIPPQNLKKIFNPFFTTKTEGLGLGLSICSRLIEENRGKIDVISKPGKGTTFTLALPSFIHR